ncbi:hypothetical protein HNP37_003339 [Flavobacterium nitrogenifigens]|uniref:Uncharacterized protein n=2 Tax=Flavobacterium TaxID=237 RepID=A0A7W7IZ46_9FLAO|nr:MULTISPECIES: hypothetical protein [Flavobacterium]MBB4803264.1 hypothetical protein [Flavobacterium nitrogenifigens]MBB6388222.1 hypothetical protein [Flavobacterium notoginsengisoli]
MKKYTALLLFALFLNGCDDGDLTVDTINFEDIEQSQACGDAATSTLVYKLKTQEALLLQMPAGSFRNENDSTYTYNIDSKGNGSYRVLYRAYDGTVATANICGTIPPSTPKITEEWIGTDGVIEIESNSNEIPNTTDGSSRITGYTHSVIFRNITFAKPSGIQTNEKFVFGNYVTTVPSASLVFPADQQVRECSYMKGVYNLNTSFYLSIENMDTDYLLQNVVTPTNQPRRRYITSTENMVYYRTVKSGTGTFTDAAICVEKKPETPTVDQTWTGQIGVENKSGMIEVTTTVVGEKTFTHTIVLRKVRLVKGVKGKTGFELGDSFVLGTITKTIP